MISFHARVAMQRNNAAFVLAMCLAVVCHLAAAQGRDWEKLRDGIRRLRMELARQDVYTFVTNRTTTPRVAPYIHSQCWVDWLPKGEERRCVVSKSRTPSSVGRAGERHPRAVIGAAAARGRCNYCACAQVS